MEPIDFFVKNKTIFLVFHVLSVVMGMGSALTSDLLFNFYSKNKTLNDTERKTLRFLSTAVWVSLIVIILSGLCIFFSDPYRYEHSQKFISKMIIMVVLLANGLFLHKVVSPHFDDRGLLKFKSKRPIRQIAFACGAVSLISWTTVCVLGTISRISYTFQQFILGYLIFTICGIIFALIIEKKTFNDKK